MVIGPFCMRLKTLQCILARGVSHSDCHFDFRSKSSGGFERVKGATHGACRNSGSPFALPPAIGICLLFIIGIMTQLFGAGKGVMMITPLKLRCNNVTETSPLYAVWSRTVSVPTTGSQP
ncbi:hypothetical protein D5086_001130 [Populus alba]|uniref:Uncharacterized protein n=1 Tax=Populus alba TaxID=43335 RepID=A0ACC4CZE4_POPAL